MRENEFTDKEGQVVLRRASAPPTVDEKLGEGEGNIREKNDALIMCRKYIIENTRLIFARMFRYDGRASIVAVRDALNLMALLLFVN